MTASRPPRAGYTGIGLLDTDLRVWGETYPPAEVARLLDANGITHVEVEELWSWFADRERRRRSDRSRAELLRWAEALGALHIKTGTELSGAPAAHERLVEELRVLAGQAADVGTRIALEPMPPATIKTPAEALAVVTDAGASGPWGVEIFSIANRARSLDDAARINFEATAAAVREVEA